MSESTSSIRTTRGDLSIQSLTGWVMFSLVAVSIACGFFTELPPLCAGLLAWLAGMLLFRKTRGLQRVQILIMLSLGSLGLLWSLINDQDVRFIEQALTANHSLIAMLLAVSFLRLVTTPGSAEAESLPTGRSAIWRTLLGVHAFAAAINYSSVMIMGERLAGNRGLNPVQAIILSRGFSMAAHWSPFFGAMGVALSNAPGSSLAVLVATGIPCAMLALLIAGWGIGKLERAEQTPLYPMHFQAMWTPSLLALVVLIAHYQLPNLSVLTLIAFASITLSVVLLLVQSGNQASGKVLMHIQTSLPNMAGETLLFLAAGVMAAGISALAYTTGIDLALDNFGATEASWLLVTSVVLAVAGIHPVISIATAGGALGPLVTDPNLLGITFLMSWALGVVVSPYSGIHLAMQGRFNVNSFNFLRWNWRFTLAVLACDLIVLHLYEAYAAA